MTLSTGNAFGAKWPSLGSEVRQLYFLLLDSVTRLSRSSNWLPTENCLSLSLSLSLWGVLFLSNLSLFSLTLLCSLSLSLFSLSLSLFPLSLSFSPLLSLSSLLSASLSLSLSLLHTHTHTHTHTHGWREKTTAQQRDANSPSPISPSIRDRKFLFLSLPSFLLCFFVLFQTHTQANS